MSLKNLPLEVSKLGAALCVSVEIKKDPDTGAVRADREGVPIWVVGVAVRPEGRKGALIEVSVSGEPKGLMVGGHVELHNLEAFWWEVGGRSGLSFRADRITPALAPLPPEPIAAPAAAGESARAGRAGAK
ncbi:hypothetical protein ABUW04_16095 [Streptacidiphilus sp. N1-10]|uniref:Uncharacterized protein n=1 Tax=Streptacidiphilus jeojiensis TaxID=3229225 RepID=A0ABV6XND6_9ACTN